MEIALEAGKVIAITYTSRGVTRKEIFSMEYNPNPNSNPKNPFGISDKTYEKMKEAYAKMMKTNPASSPQNLTKDKEPEDKGPNKKGNKKEPEGNERDSVFAEGKKKHRRCFICEKTKTGKFYKDGKELICQDCFFRYVPEVDAREAIQKKKIDEILAEANVSAASA